MARKPRPPINYPVHTLVAFGGKLNGGPEVWMNTVRVGRSGGNANECALLDPKAYMNAIQAGLKTWFTAAGTSSRMALSTAATLEWLKVNNIAQTGLYVDRSHTNQFTYSPAGAGSVTPGLPVGVITCAISWTTAQNRGPGHTGRIYPPLALQTLSGGGFTISSTTQDAINQTGKELLNVLATPDGTDASIVPIVVSAVDASWRPITGVRCGSVLDMQRRRKEQLTETYRAVAWP